ncbi:Uncharacterised protein [Burkholderia pseudomallei]|uniref:hypothetical protein n=1 Tax=Burkholderia pseudomallei TaxID=28450 RepID=UPI000F19F551|nr:hypothetical protein [Burkholderia pseudomallei]CAJ3123644.1 Uncharacterised protein [Burkholderia pseudomallei]VCG58819.1 Uncharacterised protein [Burkholderia pseudomallei]VCG85767.1 Uncharacterised protein [Burkholderia pseudomallei]VCG85938.1 Uncharacterised protein [Burkholderia pseudomallei]VCH02556.1 Uncharacterised protein [Burkholderia pseudomallei]
MKRLLRNIGELFALWIVVATILFLIVWLVLPQLGIMADDDRAVSVVHSHEA